MSRGMRFEQKSIRAKVLATASKPLTDKAQRQLRRMVDALTDFAHERGVCLHLKLEFPPTKERP